MIDLSGIYAVHLVEYRHIYHGTKIPGYRYAETEQNRKQIIWHLYLYIYTEPEDDDHKDRSDRMSDGNNNRVLEHLLNSIIISGKYRENIHHYDEYK